jgi:ATP-dependent DNA helicase RecG
VLKDLLERGVVAYTIPEKPQSRLQKYRLTDTGRSLLAKGETGR